MYSRSTLKMYLISSNRIDKGTNMHLFVVIMKILNEVPSFIIITISATSRSLFYGIRANEQERHLMVSR